MGKWVKRKLGEVAKTFTGLTYSPNQVSENGILVLRSSNIKDEQLCLEDNVFVSMDIPERAIVHENDILICVRNGSRNLIGKSTFIPKEAEGMAFGAFMTILRSDLIEPRLLLYIWQSNSIQRQVANNIGATINQITNTDFKNFDISYPSTLSEQRRIASILSSADKVIDSTQKLIAKYKQIKQGMMEDLLKPKEGWKKVKFDNFFEMLPNNTLSREDLNSQGGSFQNIHYGDVLIKYPYCLDCNIHEIPYINRDVKFNSTKAIDGDIIFADTAEDDTVGKCVELINVGDRKIVSGLHTYLCRPKFKMSVGYLGYFLNSNVYHNQLLPYIAGSKVSSVNRKSIAQTYICFPDLSEQRRIASILSSIDKKIESEEKVLEKYKNIKKGLMEKLLSGE